jgi:hypothetical protein
MDAPWFCQYATYDDEVNGIGYPAISVGVIKENTFVALVYRSSPNSSYLVSYTDADSAKGRMGVYGYGSVNANFHQPWISGFDMIEMLEAYDIAVTKDSLIYVASNDAEHNILVFRMTADSIESTEYRIITGSEQIYSVDVDESGTVFVTRTGDSTNAGSVLIYDGIKSKTDEWQNTHVLDPVKTIAMPEPGYIRSVAAGPMGIIYISNYTSKKVYCLIPTPEGNYNFNDNFFSLTDQPIASDGTTLNPGPWGLNFMPDKNLLFVACATNFQRSVGYEYGRFYVLNPLTGAILNTIDTALWNFNLTGGYLTRDGGTVPGNASGYASPYNLDFDENYDVYAVCYWGWSVDKWNYQGTLPVIDISIVGVENEKTLPEKFVLHQNYPNPFNPATTISYQVAKEGQVTLKVYDALGNLVSKLVDEYKPAGKYSVEFSAKDNISSGYASGVYFYEFKCGEFRDVQKMLLLK